MLDEDGDRVGFRVGLTKEILVGHLLESLLDEAAVPPQTLPGVRQIPGEDRFG